MFSNYQLILLFFILATVFILTRVIEYDTIDPMEISDYNDRITEKRKELQKKVETLHGISSVQVKSTMDKNILLNILWTVVASTLLYYVIVN
jgi:hypothetical protein